MTKEQATLLSLIRAIVRGAQGVPLAMDVCGSKAMDEKGGVLVGWYGCSNKALKE